MDDGQEMMRLIRGAGEKEEAVVDTTEEEALEILGCQLQPITTNQILRP